MRSNAIIISKYLDIPLLTSVGQNVLYNIYSILYANENIITANKISNL